jgi:hypothetical protein
MNFFNLFTAEEGMSERFFRSGLIEFSILTKVKIGFGNSIFF